MLAQIMKYLRTMMNKALTPNGQRVRLMVRYRTSGSDGKMRSGRTSSLSPFDLSVACNVLPNPSETLEIEVKIPGQSPIPLRAMVTRRRQPESRFRGAMKSDFSLKIVDAPERWFQYCWEITTQDLPEITA